MVATTPPPSLDFSPQAPGCLCWDELTQEPAPFRCDPCVSALVLDECEREIHGRILAEHARDASDAAGVHPLYPMGGDLLPELVLDQLCRMLAKAGRRAALLVVAERRGVYASQVRPSHDLDPRPVLRVLPGGRHRRG